MTFRQSRFKLALVFVLTAFAALTLAFFAFVTAHVPGLWSAAGYGVFAPLALAVAVAAYQNARALAAPSQIAAGETGVVFTTASRTRHYAWDAIADFTVFSPSSRMRSPGLELKEAVNGRRFISFGRNWEKAPEEIVEALKSARPSSNRPASAPGV